VPTEGDRHTRMKCHECHKMWKADRPEYFDRKWKRYITPLARSHKDLKKWLEEQRKDQKQTSLARLAELEHSREDEAGNFMYDAYANSVETVLNTMSLYVYKIMAERRQTASQSSQGGQPSDGSSSSGSCSGSCSGSSCPGSDRSKSTGSGNGSHGKHSKSGSNPAVAPKARSPAARTARAVAQPAAAVAMAVAMAITRAGLSNKQGSTLAVVEWGE
jgi:hypothetical protein